MKMKLFTSIAAVGLVAAMGTSAMAATLTETTNGATASVAALPESSGQMTVLVAQIDESCVAIDETTGAATVTNPTIDDNTIIYIDQQAYASGIFQEMGLKTTLTAGSYYLVRVGGENMEAIYEEVYKVVEEGGSEGTDYVVGDSDGNGSITIGDVTALIDKVLNKVQYFTDANDAVLPMNVGDTDCNGSITIGDVTTAIDKVLNKIENFTNVKYTLPAGTTAESTYVTE